MNKAFEKILDRLEATKDIAQDDSVAELVSTRIWNKAIHRAKQIVQEVAGEYNGGWIPCSERLPEESGHYLICDNRGRIYECTYLANMWLIAAPSIDVIAWQPLPEPFKERD